MDSFLSAAVIWIIIGFVFFLLEFVVLLSKSISPPQSIKDTMEKQMRAEREKRALIAESEGDKQAKINRAKGEKQQTIALSEGKKLKRINEAGGKASENGSKGRNNQYFYFQNLFSFFNNCMIINGLVGIPLPVCGIIFHKPMIVLFKSRDPVLKGGWYAC